MRDSDPLHETLSNFAFCVFRWAEFEFLPIEKGLETYSNEKISHETTRENFFFLYVKRSWTDKWTLCTLHTFIWILWLKEGIYIHTYTCDTNRDDQSFLQLPRFWIYMQGLHLFFFVSHKHFESFTILTSFDLYVCHIDFYVCMFAFFIFKNKTKKRFTYRQLCWAM